MSAAALVDGAAEAEARAMLERCCGASRWVTAMLARRPFGGDRTLLAAADEEWGRMERADVLEALTHHPRIGADLDELKKRYGATASWAAAEQAGAGAAGEATLIALRDANVRYETRFGHIFVVCATGKTAAEMLALLEARMANTKETELAVAAGEQAKITKIRLEKLA
jgi:2-oxo-4-hydroxy-4-carboxy-5-ureidoimidazoline decarboxylase